VEQGRRGRSGGAGVESAAWDGGWLRAGGRTDAGEGWRRLTGEEDGCGGSLAVAKEAGTPSRRGRAALAPPAAGQVKGSADLEGGCRWQREKGRRFGLGPGAGERARQGSAGG
jgi:hypothetical protein